MKLHYGESNGHVLDDVTRPYCSRRVNGCLAEVVHYEHFSSLFVYLNSSLFTYLFICLFI